MCCDCTERVLRLPILHLLERGHDLKGATRIDAFLRPGPVEMRRVMCLAPVCHAPVLVAAAVHAMAAECVQRRLDGLGVALEHIELDAGGDAPIVALDVAIRGGILRVGRAARRHGHQVHGRIAPAVDTAEVDAERELLVEYGKLVVANLGPIAHVDVLHSVNSVVASHCDRAVLVGALRLHIIRAPLFSSEARLIVIIRAQTAVEHERPRFEHI